jgi:hypothetical protein
MKPPKIKPMFGWAIVGQRWPEEHKPVLLQFPAVEDSGTAPSIVVGYMRHPAGVKSEHNFISRE